MINEKPVFLAIIINTYMRIRAYVHGSYYYSGLWD